MTLNDDGTYLWITDLATNKPRQITKSSALTTFVTNYELINGGKQAVMVFPPDGRSVRPTAPPVPAGPELSISMDADRNRIRTFPSLMKTPYDQALYRYLEKRRRLH